MKINFRFYHWLPQLLRVGAITLYPNVLFADAGREVNKVLIQHEFIHVRQIEKVGKWVFYKSYIKHYFVNLWKYRTHVDAYLNIPWEVEAYAHQASTPLSPTELERVVSDEVFRY